MMKYVLTTEHSFDGAHYLRGHRGACANIHGHRWRVVMEIGGNELQPEGSSRAMVMDFTDMKQEFRQLVDDFDHSLILEDTDMTMDDMHEVETVHVNIAGEETETRAVYIGFRPTAENFSNYIYNVMKKKGYPVYAVTVYETPTNSCRYCPQA